MADDSMHFLPAELAGDTVEGLLVEHGAERAWTLWLLVAGVAGALGVLPLAQVDIAVRAPGLVRPASERAEVRPAVSGHIALVLAHENDRVQNGQPLLVLASGGLDERLARNQALQRARAEAIEDLRRLTTEPVPPARNSDESEVPLGPFRTEALEREHAQLRAQLAANRIEETKAQTEHGRLASLAAKGIASRSDLDRAHFEVERLRAEAELMVRQTLARWQGRLREEESAAADLASEEKRLCDELRQFTLRAPATGTLIGFTAASAGGFVSAGQSLGAVSPSDSLLVEAIVSPQDIGLIAPGQPVRIAVDAFPYIRFGMLEGTVVSISGDSLGSSAGTPVFKVRVRPDRDFPAQPGGNRAVLRKGLTVQARFLVGRRSLLELLYDDASTWLDPRWRDGRTGRATPHPSPA